MTVFTSIRTISLRMALVGGAVLIGLSVAAAANAGALSEAGQGSPVSTTSHGQVGPVAEPRHAGLRTALGAVADHALNSQSAPSSRTNRSMAATSVKCSNPYRTTIYARRWPGNGSSWTEGYCVKDDYSVAGSWFIDINMLYWTGSAWSLYGTWYEHMTYQGVGVVVDYCWWWPTGGSRTATFYSGCP